MPRSVQGIVDLTGCSKDQVKTYLSRRRREARRLVGTIPDIRMVPIKMTTDNNEEFFTTEILDYHWMVDHWSAATCIKATMPGSREVRFQVARPNLFKDLVERAYADLGLVPHESRLSTRTREESKEAEI